MGVDDARVRDRDLNSETTHVSRADDHTGLVRDAPAVGGARARRAFYATRRRSTLPSSRDSSPWVCRRELQRRRTRAHEELRRVGKRRKKSRNKKSAISPSGVTLMNGVPFTMDYRLYSM